MITWNIDPTTYTEEALKDLARLIYYYEPELAGKIHDYLKTIG
jgi:hypothetical protein